MSKLYIIGNGFDLKHGLPSRYSDFARFCEITNWKLYEQINILFPNITKDSLWSNFEEGLGSVDTDKLYSLFYKSYKSDKRNDGFLKLHTELKGSFRDWIISLKALTKILQRQFVFDNNDCFITFNYTNTLEASYNIKDCRILHIHGYATPDDEGLYTDYIFGHKQPEQKSQDIIDSFDYLSKDFSNGFRKDFKVTELSDKITIWRREGIAFEKIVVLGHSLNEIDDDYMQTLLKLLPNKPWIVEYLNLEDYYRKNSNLQRLQLPITKISFIRSYSMCKEIITCPNYGAQNLHYGKCENSGTTIREPKATTTIQL